MDFFARQDSARRSTFWLVLLFFLAVLATIVALYSALYLVLLYYSPRTVEEFGFWNLKLMGGVSLGAGLIIGLGSLYKFLKLRDGGRAVAEFLGGELVPPDTSDPLERRLVNVVEEVSIASGIPVPAIYRLRGETGINAFAAGFGFEDSAIGVTDGALSRLKRDELQGVIAHEFSHLLNGDMRLNIHLMGWLHGILLLTIIGKSVFRGGGNSRVRVRSRGKGAGAIYLVALVLVIVGYVGHLFGRLIQAAVSRQRESLADASAVQFTRNPAGLAGALKKIGGYSGGGRIGHPNAEGASHLFFSDPIKDLFSTHPPMAERIRSLEPGWEGDYLASSDEAVDLFEEGRAHFNEVAPALAGAAPLSGTIKAAPSKVESTVGTFTDKHIEYAEAILGTFDERLVGAARSREEVHFLIYAMALSGSEKVRAGQAELLSRRLGESGSERVLGLHAALSGAGHRTPLLDIAFPLLRRLGHSALQEILVTVREIGSGSRPEDIYPLVVESILIARIAPLVGTVNRGGRGDLQHLAKGFSTVIGALAYHGAEKDGDAALAFNGAIEMLPSSRLPEELPSHDAFIEALAKLAKAKPAAKRQILRALLAVTNHDCMVTAREAELVRAIAERLSIPLPPIVPDN